MSLLVFNLSLCRRHFICLMSRPCCLSEFCLSRAFRMGIGIYSGGERGLEKSGNCPHITTAFI